MPQLEHQQRPKLMGVIAAPALVLIDQMADGFLVEIAAPRGAFGEYRFFQEVPQLAAQP